jgi:predicted nuclease of predicted toxin-antitoxin system
MNLPPDWIRVLEKYGWECVHWSEIGDPRAADREIMDWAVANRYVVFTHDLDFGALLATTRADGPSVIQVRTQNVMPEHLEPVIVAALRQFESILQTGALISVDETHSRARVLPLTR